MPDVASAVDAGRLAADEGDRQVVVEVRVAVADAGAVEEQRVVEHHAVALRHRRQLLDQVRELLEVVLVDLVQPLELRCLVLMVRQRMVRVRDADLRIRAAADFAREHEGADAGQVGLVGQRQQVHHQLGVLAVVARHADRLIDDRQLPGALLLGHLDAPLGVADRLEVLVELHLVARTDGLPRRSMSSPTKSRTLLSRVIRSSRAAWSVLPLVPNSRSNTARGSFSIGSGVVGVRQAIVFVYAQLAPPSQEPSIAFDSMPSSSDASWVSSEFRRGHLVHRHRREHVGARRDLEGDAGQEGAGRSRVIAAALGPGSPARQPARRRGARDP